MNQTATEYGLETTIRDLTERLTHQEEATRRLEATLLALSRFDTNHHTDPTSTALVRTPRYYSNSPTPRDLRWPAKRQSKVEPEPIPAPELDGTESDLLWATAGFVSDPLVGLDLAGRVRVWNPAAESVFGWQAHEVIGFPCPFLPDDKRDEHILMLQRALDGVAVRDVASIRRRKNGSLVAVRVSAAGHTQGAAFIFKPEIGETTTPTVPLSVDTAVGIKRIVGAVVHDLNNLFTVICGGSESLMERIALGDPRHADSEMVHSASIHAARIVQQLMAVVDHHTPFLSKADLHIVARDITPVLRGMLNTNVELIVIDTPDRVAPVAIDPAKLSQVLLNLVANANDAMPDGGTITVITSHESDGTIMLSVSDTGIGMDSTTLGHIFDRSFSTKSNNRGIGLSTVFDICKQAEGQITVDSARGIGTTFCIRFPKPENVEADGSNTTDARR